MVESTHPAEVVVDSRAKLAEAVENAVAGAARGLGRAELMSFAERAYDEAVWLIRRGTQSEIASAAATIARFAGRQEFRNLVSAAPVVADRLRGLQVVLLAAEAPDGPSGSDVVERSWGGKASLVVSMIAQAQDRTLTRQAVKAKLAQAGQEVSESALSHMLSDLEAARQIERIREPGQRYVRLRLGVDAPAEAGVSTHVYVGPAPRWRAIEAPTNERLQATVEAQRHQPAGPVLMLIKGLDRGTAEARH